MRQKMHISYMTMITTLEKADLVRFAPAGLDVITYGEASDAPRACRTTYGRAGVRQTQVDWEGMRRSSGHFAGARRILQS